MLRFGIRWHELYEYYGFGLQKNFLRGLMGVCDDVAQEYALMPNGGNEKGD